jgi:prophage antirepressor-like protein
MEQNPMPFLEVKEIRYVSVEGEKWFSMIDVVEVLTESSNPAAYWRMFKRKLLKKYSDIPVWKLLKMTSKDNKTRNTDCSNIEGVLRIVMSIPSPKAEPLKMWLCEQVKNRIEES